MSLSSILNPRMIPLKQGVEGSKDQRVSTRKVGSCFFPKLSPLRSLGALAFSTATFRADARAEVPASCDTRRGGPMQLLAARESVTLIWWDPALRQAGPWRRL